MSVAISDSKKAYVCSIISYDPGSGHPMSGELMLVSLGGEV